MDCKLLLAQASSRASASAGLAREGRCYLQLQHWLLDSFASLSSQTCGRGQRSVWDLQSPAHSVGSAESREFVEELESWCCVAWKAAAELLATDGWFDGQVGAGCEGLKGITGRTTLSWGL